MLVELKVHITLYRRQAKIHLSNLEIRLYALIGV